MWSLRLWPGDSRGEYGNIPDDIRTVRNALGGGNPAWRDAVSGEWCVVYDAEAQRKGLPVNELIQKLTERMEDGMTRPIYGPVLVIGTGAVEGAPRDLPYRVILMAYQLGLMPEGFVPHKR